MVGPVRVTHPGLSTSSVWSYQPLRAPRTPGAPTFSSGAPEFGGVDARNPDGIDRRREDAGRRRGVASRGLAGFTRAHAAGQAVGGVRQDSLGYGPYPRRQLRG